MKCNVGRVDQIIRIIIGAALIALGFIYQCWWGAIGILPLLTGIFRFCPPYVLFKINTCCKNCQDEKK